MRTLSWQMTMGSLGSKAGCGNALTVNGPWVFRVVAFGQMLTASIEMVNAVSVSFSQLEG